MSFGVQEKKRKDENSDDLEEFCTYTNFLKF